MPLEVCIDSTNAAYEALFGDANRVEICGELSVGGITPSIGLFESIMRVLRPWNRVQTRVMIRPRSGDFVYSDSEIAAMIEDIRQFKERGVSGFVFGCLNKDFTLNEKQCAQLIAEAAPLPCTLHRCFDWTPNWQLAIDKAAALGFDTILTSGQKPTVGEAVETLAQMARYASGAIASHTQSPITIMAGSGLNGDSLNRLLSESTIQWFHSSASNSVQMATESLPPFPMGPSDGALRKCTDRNIVKLQISIINAAGR